MNKIKKENIIKCIMVILKDLQETCKVLNGFGITSIGYSRFYTNSCVRISSNFEWIKYYITNDVLYFDKERYIRELSHIGDKKFHIILRAQDENSKAIVPLMHKYNQDNVCSFYIKSHNYIEMFGFATDVGKESLTNFYINNINFLLKYTLLFKEKLLPFINNNIDNLLLPFNPFIPGTLKTNTNINIYNDVKINPKKIFLTDDFIVTKKEFECLCYLSKGYSYKEIAQKMKISSRTVETHINHTKYKLGGTYKGNILQVLENSLINLNSIE